MEEQFQLSFVSFPKDAYITVEGERKADQFYIIREGKVRLSKNFAMVADDKSNDLGPGDFFGVVSTMSGQSHIETARALTNVVLLPVRQNQFTQLIQRNTSAVRKILSQFSKRMRYLNESLTQLTLKNNAQINSEHLFVVADYYAKQGQFNHAHYAFTHYIKHCPNGSKVRTAQERLKKIAPKVSSRGTNFKPDEMTRDYPVGTMIFSEGEPGEEIFIIKSGSVKIAKVTADGEVLLAVLKSGDIFGEMALLDSSPRGASAIAYEKCQVMVVNKSNFDQIIESQPQLVARLTTMLAERIWISYKQLANTGISDPLGRMYDMLLIQLEKKRINLEATRAYQFDFGVTELIGMVGLPRNEGTMLTQRLLQNNLIRVTQGKIQVDNVCEFAKKAAYYRKMQELAQNRKK